MEGHLTAEARLDQVSGANWFFDTLLQLGICKFLLLGIRQTGGGARRTNTLDNKELLFKKVCESTTLVPADLCYTLKDGFR